MKKVIYITFALALIALTAAFVQRQLPNEPLFYYYVLPDGQVDTVRRGVDSSLVVVRENGKRGYADTAGQLVIPPQFENANLFVEQLASVSVDGRWGFIRTDGSFAIEPRFAMVRPFHEGLAPARIEYEQPWGYIDTKGAWVIQPQFDVAFRMRNGVARVGMETTWSRIRGRFLDVGGICRFSYVNARGEQVAPPADIRFGHPPRSGTSDQVPPG